MYKQTEITIRTRNDTYNTSSTILDDFMNLTTNTHTDTDSQYRNNNNKSDKRVQTRAQSGNKTHNYNYNKNITINNYYGNSDSSRSGNNKHYSKNNNRNNNQRQLKNDSRDRKQIKPYLKIDSSNDVTYFKVKNFDLSPINMSFNEFIVNKKFWINELKPYFDNNVDINKSNQINLFLDNLKNVIIEVTKLTKHINNTMNSFSESGHRHNKNIIKLKDGDFYINNVNNDNGNNNNNSDSNRRNNNERNNNERNNNYRGQQSPEYVIYFELGNNIVHFIMTNKKINKSISISRGSYDKNMRFWQKCIRYFNKYASRNQSNIYHFWENLEYTVASHSHLGNYVYNLMNTFK